ncbi:MAG: hypothetical protein ACREQY_22610 [Candidatus Binatia bacterium]
MRRFLLLALLCLATASAARATDVDLAIGVRAFGSDHERWPEVGLGVRLGPDLWKLKPEVGLAIAEDPLYGGTLFEGSAGLGGDFPHVGRNAFDWGLGYARLRYEIGANEGEADATYFRLGWRWVRPAAADLGIAVRYLDGPDIVLRSGYESSGEVDPGFRESISTFVVSFRLRW